MIIGKAKFQYYLYLCNDLYDLFIKKIMKKGEEKIGKKNFIHSLFGDNSLNLEI